MAIKGSVAIFAAMVAFLAWKHLRRPSPPLTDNIEVKYDYIIGISVQSVRVCARMLVCSCVCVAVQYSCVAVCSRVCGCVLYIF